MAARLSATAGQEVAAAGSAATGTTSPDGDQDRFNLKFLRGFEVRGRVFSPKECLERCLSLYDKHPDGWTASTTQQIMAMTRKSK